MNRQGLIKGSMCALSHIFARVRGGEGGCVSSIWVVDPHICRVNISESEALFRVCECV